MGCSTLYHLAKAGISDAILVERNQLTSGTTWHSAAQVRALRSTKNLTSLIRYSIELYAGLEAQTGQHTGWINKGSLSIATTEDRLIHIKRQAALAKLYGVRAQSIDKDEVKEYWPHMNTDDVIGAVWSPDDGRVSPTDLCAALTKGARSRGARIFENTAIEGILTRYGTIVGVETDRGTIKCDAVVLCAGLWSRALGVMAGTLVPVWPCEHFYLLTEPLEGISGNLPTLSDHDGHLYIRDDSGGLLVGCFEPLGKSVSADKLGPDFAFQLLDEDWDHFEPMMRNAMHRLPLLESARVKMLLNGPESFTPDGSFLLGESTEVRNLFLGCGMNSIGVAAAGGAGMALAHSIQYGHMPMDLHEVDPARFPSVWSSAELLAARVPEVLGSHYEITYPGRQWTKPRHLQVSPLYDDFGRESTHFGQIFGWERPLYTGKSTRHELTFGKPQWHENVAREVHAAHNAAAIFDLSSFGKIEVEGVDACKFLNRVCTGQMDSQSNRAIYTSMLNDRGGIESNFIAVRLEPDRYRLYVATAAIRKDLSWLERNLCDSENVNLFNATELYSVIGLAGPQSASIARALGVETLNELEYFEFSHVKISQCPTLALRVSYVGEAGWELTCLANDAREVYQNLHRLGAQPAGLYAQNSMRIEKRYLAYGYELDSQISPLEAGLGFTVDWSKDFIGKQALLAQRDAGVQNRVVSIVFDDVNAVPLGDEPVQQRGKMIGKTTSASFGFRIGAPIALAVIDKLPNQMEELLVKVDIGGQLFSGRVLTKPAF